MIIETQEQCSKSIMKPKEQCSKSIMKTQEQCSCFCERLTHSALGSLPHEEKLISIFQNLFLD